MLGSLVLEREVKVLGINYASLIRRLKKQNAKKVGVVYIRDWYVDIPGKSTKKLGKKVRLRSYGGEKFEITIKTKVKDASAKVRQENNISVPSLKAGLGILGMCGFEHVWYKEKIRVTYAIGETIFDIDFYDGLPPVLEIEGSEQQIAYWIRKLRLHKHKQVDWGAKKLLKWYKKKQEIR